jgi:hypothetical protein
VHLLPHLCTWTLTVCAGPIRSMNSDLFGTACPTECAAVTSVSLRLEPCMVPCSSSRSPPSRRPRQRLPRRAQLARGGLGSLTLLGRSARDTVLYQPH